MEGGGEGGTDLQRGNIIVCITMLKLYPSFPSRNRHGRGTNKGLVPAANSLPNLYNKSYKKGDVFLSASTHRIFWAKINTSLRLEKGVELSGDIPQHNTERLVFKSFNSSRIQHSHGYTF